MYYFKYNETGDIIGVGFSPDGTIVGEGIECTEEQKDNWQLLKIIKGEIVDKYTPEEIAAQVAEQAVNQLRFEAERLHEETTEAMASDMFATFTTPEQIELTNYRIDLRLAINDPSNNTLPAKPTWLAEWLTQ